MLPGFRTRLIQELKHLINTMKEFEEIKETQEYFQVHESCIPPNCMVWVGASLLSQLNSEIEKFEITQRDYVEKFDQCYIPDRFGEAFLFGIRDTVYFNKDFEEFLKQ